MSKEDSETFGSILLLLPGKVCEMPLDRGMLDNELGPEKRRPNAACELIACKPGTTKMEIA
jgi:hypothetical protein